MSRIFFSLLCSIIWISSCRQVQNSGAGESAVTQEFDKQLKNLDSTWNAMIKSDDNKIDNMNRLVKELQMIDGSNVLLLNAADKAVRELKNRRYDQASMKLSHNIDIYDSATNQTIQKLRNETTQNPNAIKYQIINQLISEIQQADDSVLFYRKEYDRTVDSFNNFIKTRKKELKKSGINTDSIRPYPLFRLLM